MATQVGNNFWLMLSASPHSSLCTWWEHNFSKAKNNLQILGDFCLFVFFPILHAPRKAVGRDVEAGWCFLHVPLTSCLTTQQCSLAGKCCFIQQDVFNLMLLSCGKRCISRVRLFCSAGTYFTVFCHILFLPLYFPKSLVTTINLCLGGCSSFLSIPQIVHLPWTSCISKSFSPPSSSFQINCWKPKQQSEQSHHIPVYERILRSTTPALTSELIIN